MVSKGFSAIKSRKLINLAFVVLFSYLIRVLDFTKKKLMTDHGQEEPPPPKTVHEHEISPIANSDWGFFCDMKEETPPINSCKMSTQSNSARIQTEPPPTATVSYCSPKNSVNADAGVSKVPHQVSLSSMNEAGSRHHDANAEELVLWDEFNGDEFTPPHK